jgi:hypothetical protein
MDFMTLWGGPVIWHQTLAQGARWVMAALALWATIAYWQRRPMGNLFLRIIAASQLMILIQSLVGAYFFVLLGWRPPAWIQHLLYGGLTLFTLPVVYYYTRKEPDCRRAARIWALACLFMFGLTFRTATTGVMWVAP